MRALVSVAALAAVLAPADAGSQVPSDPGVPRVWSAGGSPSHRLRADFEIPTDVVIAYSHLFPVEATALAGAIAPSAHVVVVLADDTRPERGRRWHRSLPPQVQRNTTLLSDVQVDSPWVRDYGPLVATDGESRRWLDTAYVAGRPLDDAFPNWLADRLGVPNRTVDATVEGGAVISDGAGHCISTMEYWDTARPVEVAEAEALLEAMGCDDLLLVPGLLHDRTRHVDMFAQFVGPNRILVAQVDPGESAEDAARMQAANVAIVRWAAEDGRDLQVVRVPLPVLEGERYFSYVNLLQLGDRAVVPHYPAIDARREMKIFATLERALGRPVFGVDMGVFRGTGGAVHCATLNLRLPQGAPWRD